jgi:hypothetical protein
VGAKADKGGEEEEADSKGVKDGKASKRPSGSPKKKDKKHITFAGYWVQLDGVGNKFLREAYANDLFSKPKLPQGLTVMVLRPKQHFRAEFPNFTNFNIG